ncbi:Phosphoglycerate mutase family protein [Euphorbia peplus]|nr:Phosphoglycerate mutase family protein [Euphorbia peplus]
MNASVLSIWRPINSSHHLSSSVNILPNSAIRSPATFKLSVAGTTILRLSVFNRFISTRSSTHVVKMAQSSDSTSSVDYAEIILVRHGETDWNADGRLQGHLDVELNEVGRQQAVTVADRLSKEPKISAIYSSDLKRALVTAETIASRCGGVQVFQDKDLRERHLGFLQGLVLSEAAKISPEAYQSFLCRRNDQDIPGGGESLDQLYERCTSSIQRIASKHIGERVIVVAHGGVIRALYRRACPNKKLVGKIVNTSINIFQISGDKNWTLKVWGDVSHLNQSGYLESGFGGDRTSG